MIVQFTTPLFYICLHPAFPPLPSELKPRSTARKRTAKAGKAVSPLFHPPFSTVLCCNTKARQQATAKLRKLTQGNTKVAENGLAIHYAA